MTRDLDRRVVRLETTRHNRRTLADWTDAELLALIIRESRIALASGTATADSLRADYAALPDVLDALGLNLTEDHHASH